MVFSVDWSNVRGEIGVIYTAKVITDCVFIFFSPSLPWKVTIFAKKNR